MTSRPINGIAITENATFSKKVREMLGLSLHTWEDLMVASLVIAAFAAAFVGITTFAVVRLQRLELAASKDEFDRYKLDAGVEIAKASEGAAKASERAEEASARAAEANEKAERELLARLKLEEKLAPRRLDTNARSGLQSSLKHVAGRRVRVESYRLDIEAQLLAEQIKDALTSVMLVEDWIGSEEPAKHFAKGINITGGDKELVAALVKAFRNTTSLDIDTVNLPPDPGGAILTEASPSKKKADAVVVVGVKPIAP